MLLTALCFVFVITICFALFAFKRRDPQDYSAMKRVFKERYEAIDKLYTPTDFYVLRKHINDDADRFRLVVDPRIVNSKREWLMQEIEKRTTELYGVQHDDRWYNYQIN